MRVFTVDGIFDPAFLNQMHELNAEQVKIMPDTDIVQFVGTLATIELREGKPPVDPTNIAGSILQFVADGMPVAIEGRQVEITEPVRIVREAYFAEYMRRIKGMNNGQ